MGPEKKGSYFTITVYNPVVRDRLKICIWLFNDDFYRIYDYFSIAF